MKVGAIIQARQTSSRLPGKALIDINGKPALQRVIERVRQAKELDDVIVACTVNPADDAIEELCKKLNCNFYRGSEEDVLTRVLLAAKSFNVDTIVEITADCPLIDWKHIDCLIKVHGSWDMTSNIIERSFPRGYDIRVFNTSKLEALNKIIDNPIDRQHVSTAFYLNPKFKDNYVTFNLLAPEKQFRPDLDITLDTPEDLELIRWLFKAGEEYRLELTCEEVINLIDTYPEKYTKVAEIKRKDYFKELEEFYSKEQTKHESNDNWSRKPRMSK